MENIDKCIGWYSLIGLKYSALACSKNKDYQVVSPLPIQDQVTGIDTVSVVAMRSIAYDGASAKRFIAFMNIPNPFGQLKLLIVCQMKYVMLLMMK